MWTFLKQQQQRGAQLHARAGKTRQARDAPDEAVADRSAQQHDRTDQDLGAKPRPGDYPATRLEDREGDITPSAPDPHVAWDEVVQPEPRGERRKVSDDDQPLPEGK